MSAVFVDLSERQWTLENKSGSISGLKATVPGDLLSDLENGGLISFDKPRYEEAICKEFLADTWTYSCSFSIPKSFNGRTALLCEGLDTLATIRVNGTIIGESDNMFVGRSFTIPRELIKASENTLSITFRSVIEECRSHTDELASWEYAPKSLNIRQRQWVRKAGCHFGWDFCPSLPTCGIWRPIHIIMHDNPRISSMTVHQEWKSPKTVVVSARGAIEFQNEAEESVATVHVKIVGPSGAILSERAYENVQLKEEMEFGSITLDDVPGDIMWWPRGYGSQPLCTMVVDLINLHDKEAFSSVSRKIGLRKIELSRGSDGKGFTFVVNDVPVLARGGSWVSTDILHGRVTPERQRELIKMCVLGNMNMIRVWGGGVYETDLFYDLCDDAGILVWQDMIFACACYPAIPEFIKSATDEIRYQIRRLASHPCIAIWCGNNENEEGMPFHCPWKDSYKADYATLFNAIVRVIAAEDPWRPRVRTSPSRCVVDGPFDDLSKDIGNGDTHFWGLWHGTSPVDISQVYEIEPRFCSEFGFQSLPDLQQANLSLDEIMWRQRSGGGHEKLLHAVEGFLPRSSKHSERKLSLTALCYLTQCFQALAVGTMIDHLRRLWPSCAGALFWQINDLWNGPSWSCLNYTSSSLPSAPLPKMLYYYAREAFAPVRVSAVRTGDKLNIWISNALTHEVSGRIVVRVLRVTDGAVLTTSMMPVRVGSMVTEHYTDIQLIPSQDPELSGDDNDKDDDDDDPPEDPNHCAAIVTFKPNPICAKIAPKNVFTLLFNIRDASSCVLGMKPYMRPRVKVVNIVVSSGNNTFSVSVKGEKGVCPFVWLGSLNGLLRYDDNGFTLCPGKIRTVCGRIVGELKEKKTANAIKKVITIKYLWKHAVP